MSSQPDPPSTPSEGTSFRITAPAAEAWAGKEHNLAVRISGAWHFVAPKEGMLVFDQAAGHQLVFRSTWTRADAPAVPIGGAVIDAQARQAVADLIQALTAVGVLSEHSS